MRQVPFPRRKRSLRRKRSDMSRPRSVNHDTLTWIPYLSKHPRMHALLRRQGLGGEVSTLSSKIAPPSAP